jgi:hypothetical protein
VTPSGRPIPTSELAPVGRARRASCSEGELWLLPASDAPLRTRLLELGRKGAFGFFRGGSDDEGIWLLRHVAGRRLDALVAGGRLDWREALTIVRQLARALAACERAAIFPGALRPSEIAIEPEVFLLGDAWLFATLGESKSTPATSRPSPRWSPPAQADGAPWDHEANRYVLGLIAYRLVSGTHPFAGGGLRHAMSAQAAGEVPPFDEELARTLRPGVQGLVLKMLDVQEPFPDAHAIVARCNELLDDKKSSPKTPNPVPAPAPQKQNPGKNRAPGASLAAWRFLPLGVGLVAALASLALAAPWNGPEPKPASSLTPATRALSSTTAADCAPCHAREVAEWQRSVMAFAGKSPLYGALESAVQEQVGRDARCPNGAGILRKVGADACRDSTSNITVTGSGGEHWCVNCHAPLENVSPRMPSWNAVGQVASRAPMRDLLPASSMEGISCGSCHQTIGPVGSHARRGGYQGNPSWVSIINGASFEARPEDRQGRLGIANSGYLLDPASFLSRDAKDAHLLPSRETKAYLESSEFCGACHDVRLFGTDVVGVRDRGEHFKRLRNGYSEWRAWADAEERAGRPAASCQGCHMSLYPGTCEPGVILSEAKDPLRPGDCPPGTHFAPRAPGEYAQGRVTPASAPRRVASHYFTSVDRPLAQSFARAFFEDDALDTSGVPLGLHRRRDMLLRKALTFTAGDVRRSGSRIEIPLRVENTGAGHRVPAGFSQEREIWVELTVTDARGAVVYEVGRLQRDDEDLRDKTFLRINTSDALSFDAKGRPLGVFGADVIDGPDVPRWSPNPSRGGTNFRGRGLINFQNGFLRCVRCLGTIDGAGRCQPGPGQGATRADRFDDGAYDADTGECRSNLRGDEALFETYLPIGALDASRGVLRAPDAIIDTRSLAPNVPVTYTFELDAGTHPAPFRIDARLRFRAFPPYLIRAFADYEAQKDRARLRPSGAQVTADMLQAIDVTDLAEVHTRLD